MSLNVCRTLDQVLAWIYSTSALKAQAAIEFHFPKSGVELQIDMQWHQLIIPSWYWISPELRHLESFYNPSLTGLRNLIYSKSPRINQRTLILQVRVILITEGRNGVILWPSSSDFCAESGRRMARNWDRTYLLNEDKGRK
jgi:hypothetical protein